MKKLYLMLLCFALFSSILYGQTKITVSATDLPPLGSPNLEGNGVLGQFVSESLKGKNYTINFEYIPFARIVALLDNNTVQTAFFNRFQANEKNYYVKTILNSNIVFFFKKSKFPNGLVFKDLSELKKYSVGIVRGAPTIEMLEKAGLTLDLANDEFLDCKKLQNDRVDLLSTCDIFGWYALKEIGADLKDYDMSKPVLLVESCFLISKSLPNSKTIIDDFNAGYEIAKKNNKLTKILETVYGKGKVPGYCIP